MVQGTLCYLQGKMIPRHNILKYRVLTAGKRVSRPYLNDCSRCLTLSAAPTHPEKVQDMGAGSSMQDNRTLMQAEDLYGMLAVADLGEASRCCWCLGGGGGLCSGSRLLSLRCRGGFRGRGWGLLCLRRCGRCLHSTVAHLIIKHHFFD